MKSKKSTPKTPKAKGAGQNQNPTKKKAKKKSPENRLTVVKEKPSKKKKVVRVRKKSEISAGPAKISEVSFPKSVVEAKPAEKKEGVSPQRDSSAKKTKAKKSVMKQDVHPSVSEGTVQEEIKVVSPKEVSSPKILLKEKTTKSPAGQALEETASEVSEKPPKQKLRVPESITVRELAERMNIKVAELIKNLMSLGSLVTINQRISPEAAIISAESYNFDLEVVPLDEPCEEEKPEDASQLLPRAPVVTVMGHVDHGKTSLLDAIRQTRVAEKEAGGITQHIGAYMVNTSRGSITFLDTPGHQAFTAMRARGAQVTDLVVLVVAVDDGIKPQTEEAVDHARAAGVPILVALNKIDVPRAQPDRVKQELSRFELVPEEWGGKTIMVEVSARQGTNIDKLLEMISLEAELLELKANPNRSAQGVVIEARMDSRRGPVATVLIQKGTLKLGVAFACGFSYGRVRAIFSYKGERLTEAAPSFPVEILGFSEVPHAGDRFNVTVNGRQAREISERRKEIASSESRATKVHMTLEVLHQRFKEGKLKDLSIIIKADVQGSVEAVRDALEKLSTAEIFLKVVHAGAGDINESDVLLAAATDAVIIGFNVRPKVATEEIARREGVEIKTYRIIYEVISDIRAAMEGLLEPEEKEVTRGRAEVRNTFRVPKLGMVAGCYVTEGKAVRQARVRLLRDGVIVFEGVVASLRRFKDDVKEIDKGMECGVGIEKFSDVKNGDVLEFYTIEKKLRKLEV